MTEDNIHIFKTNLEVAETLASDIFSRIMEKLSRQRYFSMALSGGNTPKLLLTVLAEGRYGNIPWDRVFLFWGDERCVPPDHPDSNFGMTRQYLLDKIVIPSKNIFRIKGENEPESEALRYSKLISDKLPSANGFPQFDLILLGLGEDGHTASIFPGQDKLLSSENICEVAIQPESKQKRISLTARVINNASGVIFLVSGSSKAPVLSRLLGEKAEAAEYPASHISPMSGDLSWYFDESAAVEIKDIYYEG